MVIISSIFLLSIGFLEINKPDYQYERESYLITKYVNENAKGVNDYRGNKYVQIVEMEKSWPKLPPLGENNKITFALKKISTNEFDTIEQYIEKSKDKGLTHIVIKERNESEFLDEIFVKESKFPYLKKVLDTSELEYKNHFKIFEIDYTNLNKN